MNNSSGLSVFITGAGGYIGKQLTEYLSEDKAEIQQIIAADIKIPEPENQLEGVSYETADIRSPSIDKLFEKYKVDVVVHLAAIVTPGKKSNREFEYSVDVLGTENILNACLKAKVKKIIISSSGAAYGYHADNSQWLDENDPIRGNQEFVYSDHKRLVEEMLAEWRNDHPELKQLIFRPGTILGQTTKNQITKLFDGKFVLRLAGAASSFVLIWDKDVVKAITSGVLTDKTGIYNLAGDGSMTIKEMTHIMGKSCITLPVPLVAFALFILKKTGLSQYGPEQIGFLQYRPVLSNRRLKEEFKYTPEKTTKEVWEYYLECLQSEK